LALKWVLEPKIRVRDPSEFRLEVIILFGLKLMLKITMNGTVDVIPSFQEDETCVSFNKSPCIRAQKYPGLPPGATE